MKNIKHNVMSANRSFIVKHDHIKEEVELGEKIVLEDDYFIGSATITGIFLNGDIEVSMESRKEHPRNTITKAIKVIENQEKNSRNSTTINLFGNTLHDWKDGRINTRAVELVATLAEEILENAEDNNENTDY